MRRPTLAGMPVGRGIFDDAAAFGRRALRSYRRRTGTTPPAPDPTGFYAAADAGPGRRGEVLGSEPLAVGPIGAGWRVRYRTLDAAGQPVVGIDGRRRARRPGAASPPVVVWVHGAGGVAPGCGPSRSGPRRLVRGRPRPSRRRRRGAGPHGPRHGGHRPPVPPRDDRGAGRARRCPGGRRPDHGGAGDVVAIAGHSAGGHAVLWANELAAGADGEGLDVRLAVAMSPVVDLAVAMDRYGRCGRPGRLPRAAGRDVARCRAGRRGGGADTGGPRPDSATCGRDRLEHLVRVFDGPARALGARRRLRRGGMGDGARRAVRRTGARRGPGAARPRRRRRRRARGVVAPAGRRHRRRAARVPRRRPHGRPGGQPATTSWPPSWPRSAQAAALGASLSRCAGCR